MNHHDVLTPQTLQCSGHDRTQIGVKDTEYLSARTGGISQRAKHIKNSPHRQLLTGTHSVFHCTVMHGGKHEADT